MECTDRFCSAGALCHRCTAGPIAQFEDMKQKLSESHARETWLQRQLFDFRNENERLKKPSCDGFRTLRQTGGLQEANRLFFHPIGLALAVHTNTDSGTDEVVDVSILQYPDGIEFAFLESDTDDTHRAHDNARNIQSAYARMYETRRLGDVKLARHNWAVESIPGL